MNADVSMFCLLLSEHQLQYIFITTHSAFSLLIINFCISTGFDCAFSSPVAFLAIFISFIIFTTSALLFSLSIAFSTLFTTDLQSFTLSALALLIPLTVSLQLLRAVSGADGCHSHIKCDRSLQV